MNSTPSSELTAAHILSVPRGDRWLVYYRLQELDIPCQCRADGHLDVTITTPATAAQVWSVMRQLTASRRDLITWLERCWS